MKEIKLTIDGREVKLTAEQIKALGIDVDDGCVCDRVKYGKSYWFVSADGRLNSLQETGYSFDDNKYAYGNYYRDEAYAKQVALHQKLNNLLRRYSEQHGGDAEWDGKSKHYYVVCGKASGDIFADYIYSTKDLNSVYFKTREVARQAIEEVVKPFLDGHPDFMW